MNSLRCFFCKFERPIFLSRTGSDYLPKRYARLTSVAAACVFLFSCELARIDRYDPGISFNFSYILGILLAGCVTPNRIAFANPADGDYELFTMNEDGSDVIQLTNNAFTDTFPSWSPDGKQLVFQSSRTGVQGLYLINADGTNERPLLVDSNANQDPVFAPDGRGIYFDSNRNSGSLDIFYLDLSTSSLTQLTNTAGAYDNYSPSVSPGSDYIYMVTTSLGNDDIARMNFDGSGFSMIVTDSFTDTEPSVAPDGSYFVFTADRDGNQEIYTAAPDGTGQTDFTNNAGNDNDASFKPDGARIVFSSDMNPSDLEIYTIAPNGSGLTMLTNNSIIDNNAAWSCQ